MAAPAKSARQPTTSSVAQALQGVRAAFAAGDFRRARALAATIGDGRHGSLPADVRRELAQLGGAWQVDPFVLQVGFVSFALYGAAWIYALAQHG